MNTTFSFRPVIWTIAGSDPSGGAGIQADIKTAHALGCEICTLIMANTVQNSMKFSKVNPTAIEVLQAQWDALIKDKPPVVIKIGLIANNQQLGWLLQQLPKTTAKIVWDPVLKATVGGSTSEEALDNSKLKQLLGLIDVITPNRQEVAYLADGSPAKTLLKEISENAAVIATGGTQNSSDLSEMSQVSDICFTQSKTLQLVSPVIKTNFSHGSGCSFATAIASFLSHDYLLRDAFMQAKAFMNKSFELSRQVEIDSDQSGSYGAFVQASWPVEQEYYPVVSNQTIKALNFPSLETNKLKLYPVIDSLYWLERLLPLGLEIIQLRLKNLPIEEVRSQIKQAVELAKPYETRLFINDYWQEAIEFGAYGVHLGQEDLEETDLNAIYQAGLRLGISTHGSYELKLAQQIQPSYLAIGAIFPTQTKDMSGQIQGLKNLAHLVKLNPEIPIVAIGGINLERAPKVLETGVKSIAVVTAITNADKPEQAVNEFMALFEQS